jgi:hypothetical protein
MSNKSCVGLQQSQGSNENSKGGDHSGNKGTHSSDDSSDDDTDQSGDDDDASSDDKKKGYPCEGKGCGRIFITAAGRGSHMASTKCPANQGKRRTAAAAARSSKNSKKATESINLKSSNQSLSSTTSRVKRSGKKTKSSKSFEMDESSDDEPLIVKCKKRSRHLLLSDDSDEESVMPKVTKINIPAIEISSDSRSSPTIDRSKMKLKPLASSTSSPATTPTKSKTQSLQPTRGSSVPRGNSIPRQPRSLSVGRSSVPSSSSKGQRNNDGKEDEHVASQRSSNKDIIKAQECARLLNRVTDQDRAFDIMKEQLLGCTTSFAHG